MLQVLKKRYVLDLHVQVLVVGATGVGSVRSCQKLLPCLKDPVPHNSRMDPPQVKTESVIGSGNASGILYLRGKKSYCAETNCGQKRVG